MKRIQFIALFLVFRVFTASSQGTDANISNYGFADAEPFIRVNPANPNNVIAAWMKITGPTQVSIFSKSSSDGGQTWSSGTTLPHLWSSFTSADVSIDFNSSGTAYICYIDADQAQDSGYVMVAGSTDGGLTWNTPVKVISLLEKPDFPIDRPWIAIDRSSASTSGNMYIMSKSVDIGAAPHHVWMKSSVDGGATWSSIRQVDDSIPVGSTSNAMAVPAVGGDGNLYAGYISYNPSQSPFVRIISIKSTDGGNTFTPYVIANLTASSAVTDTFYQFSYTMCANPVNNNNLIFTWTDGRYGDADILASVSDNAGVTWSAPVRINDDPQGNGVGQDMCWASFSSTGQFACAWRDRRNGGTSSQSPFEVYAMLSLDGGASFTPNYRLSSAASPFINVQKGNDFLGVSLTGNYIISDWCDLRNNNLEIFCRKEQLSNVIGIGDIQNNTTSFTCYPNPASQELTAEFELSKDELVKITVCDINGRELKQVVNKKMSRGRQQVSFNIASLAAGTYLCRLECGNKVSVAGFEKTK